MGELFSTKINYRAGALADGAASNFSENASRLTYSNNGSNQTDLHSMPCSAVFPTVSEKNVEHRCVALPTLPLQFWRILPLTLGSSAACG